MEQAPLYNKWHVKSPGNPIMFANCNSKNTSETGLYIHWFWAEAFWEVVEACNNRGKNIYPDVTTSPKAPRALHPFPGYHPGTPGTFFTRAEILVCGWVYKTLKWLWSAAVKMGFLSITKEVFLSQFRSCPCAAKTVYSLCLNLTFDLQLQTVVRVNER